VRHACITTTRPLAVGEGVSQQPLTERKKRLDFSSRPLYSHVDIEYIKRVASRNGTHFFRRMRWKV